MSVVAWLGGRRRLLTYLATRPWRKKTGRSMEIIFWTMVSVSVLCVVLCRVDGGWIK